MIEQKFIPTGATPSSVERAERRKERGLSPTFLMVPHFSPTTLKAKVAKFGTVLTFRVKFRARTLPPSTRDLQFQNFLAEF